MWPQGKALREGTTPGTAGWKDRDSAWLGSREGGGTRAAHVLGTDGASWAPALINQLGSSGPGPKHIAHGPQGLSTCSCIQAGAHQAQIQPQDPSPERRRRREGERRSPEQAISPFPRLGVAASNTNQMILLFSRCQGTKKQKRGEGRQGKDPCLRRLLPPPTCARPTGPRR